MVTSCARKFLTVFESVMHANIEDRFAEFMNPAATYSCAQRPICVAVIEVDFVGTGQSKKV